MASLRPPRFSAGCGCASSRRHYTPHSLGSPSMMPAIDNPAWAGARPPDVPYNPWQGGSGGPPLSSGDLQPERQAALGGPTGPGVVAAVAANPALLALAVMGALVLLSMAQRA